MENAIAINNLVKTYHTNGDKRTVKHALQSINLTIPKGAFFGLLGPNGAGKSTLINILSGLTIKSAGTVSICDYDIEQDMRAARLCIGVVPQELVLDTFFTVREALEIHAGYFGVPKSQRRTDEIIKAMALEDKADINSRRLSGGMRRRLLIGKALVHNPAVLVLDEPTAGVDVELREQLWNYIRQLNKAGTTILLTTHYLEEAEELCDHIAIINHGKIVADEPKEKLLSRLDSKQLLIKTSEEIRKIPDNLQHYNTKIQGQNLVLNYRPSKTNMNKLLYDITSSGLSICDISTLESDLEDIFRQLIAGKQ